MIVNNIFKNVVNNLYQYTKDKLHISTVQLGNYLIIKIKDNGPG